MIYVSQDYFSYKTTTRVETHLENLIRYPAVIICVKISHFLNKKTSESNEFKADLRELTINEMFSLTPSPNETISGCYLRTNKLIDFIKYENPGVCYDNFLVKKWILGLHVCYHFHPRHGLTYLISSVAKSLGYELQVYDILLSSFFDDVTEIFTPAFYPSLDEGPNIRLWYPADSHKFGDIVTLYEGENWVSFRPIAENFDLLPIPYDTACVPLNDVSLSDCLINRTVTELNRYPFVELTNSSFGHLTILNSFDLAVNETSLKWKEIDSDCHLHYSNSKCKKRIHANNIHQFYHHKEFMIRLSAHVPKAYARYVFAIPQMNWIEYVSGVCSSISIWFGISALSVHKLYTASLSFMPLRIRLAARLNARLNLCFSLNNEVSRRVDCNILLYVLCFIGFSYQVFQICMNYFEYKTTTKVEVLTTDFYKYQSISLCFGYLGLLNRTNYLKYGFKPTPQEAFLDFRNQLSILTVKQIFELTPDEKSLVSACRVRDEFYYELNELSLDDCHHYFRFHKAVQGENVCYYITPRDDLNFSWTKVANSFLNQGHVYDLWLTPGINGKIVIVTSYEGSELDPYPLLSRNFAERLSFYKKDPNETADNVITAYSFLNQYKALPPPYDTRCVNDDKYSHCRKHCLDEKLATIHRVHYSLVEKNVSLDMKYLNFEDLENTTVLNLVNKTEHHCYRVCSRSPCRQTISFTDAYSDYLKSEDSSLRIKSCVPASPTVHIESMPDIRPIDFFQYVCNCFGIWFGLSVMSINPFTVLSKHQSYLRYLSRHHSNRYCRFKIIQVFSLIFCLLCVTGFFIQTSELSKTYFAYKTSSRIEVESTDDLRYPNIVFCSRFIALIDWNQVNVTRNESNKLTVRQIFALTPEANDSLAGCTTRYDQSEEMKFQGSQHCLQIFYAIKFVAGADVCYGFIPHGQYIYSQRKVTRALTDLGMIYKLHLSNLLSHAKNPTFITYFLTSEYIASTTPDRWLPIQSRSFADRLVADSDSSNYFIFQGTSHNISLLPEPYDTQCTYNESMESCPQDCNIHYIRSKVNRLPFNEVLYSHDDLQILSDKDLQNEIVKEIVSQGTEYCKNKCRQTVCDYDYALTEVNAYNNSFDSENRITLVAGVPKANGLTISSFPFMTLFTYLNNIGVSASVWFGFSILSVLLYPYEYYTRTSKKTTRNVRKQHNCVTNHQKGENSKRKMIPRIYCPCSICQSFFKHHKIIVQKSKTYPYIIHLD